ncbi:ATPase, AAA-type, core, P-loop containing nucleoside triphosphate hydrolase [Tanacetum coccineum]|uniref:ATPase, AAA-type, core, P-loop containing nucleoside triphosphate hydrolase n=1 Tax=Tanacetum coccineum TaxID=301880 RepID=A0ABQ5HSR1_9ASTR
MTTNHSIRIPKVPLLLHSINNINKIHSLSFPISGFNHNASGRQNTTPFRFQCRCTNEENRRQIKTFGPIRDGISNLTSKWMSVVLSPILELFLLKREPQKVSFNELMGVDDIIKPFRQLLAKLFSSSKMTEPKNVSLDQLIGMDTAISQIRKISVEKWTVKLIGGVGKSATTSLKNTTNGREKGLKLRILKRLQGSAEYDRMNMKVPSGILIHGPNQTGKSSLLQGKEIEKNPPMIVSLFSEARVSSPSIIYIEGIEVITSTGVSQILYQMEICENDGAAFAVISMSDNVKTLDYVLLEDRDKIWNYIPSGTPGMVWKNIKAICNECCAHVIEERETAIGVCSWVTFEDVTKTLKYTKYRISMLEEKDATGKEYGTIVGVEVSFAMEEPHPQPQQQHLRRMRDVKRLVGNRFSDSQVQEEIKSLPFKNLKETVEAYIGTKVSMINNDMQQRMNAQKQDESRVESGTKDRSKDEDFDS